MNKPVIYLLPMLFLVGCASQSTVTPYGGDKYIMSVDDALGLTSPDRLKVTAVEMANAHCGQRKRRAQVIESSGGGITGWTSTSASVVFRCQR